MLRSLAGAGLGVILLPRKASAFPIIEDVFDEVLAQRGVELRCAGFMGTAGLCYVLGWETMLALGGGERVWIEEGKQYQERFDSEVIDGHPYW